MMILVFYDVTRFIFLFFCMYFLRFGPNKYSILIKRHEKLKEMTYNKNSAEEYYSIILKFSEQNKDFFKRDIKNDEKMLNSISGYFSEDSSSIVMD